MPEVIGGHCQPYRPYTVDGKDGKDGNVENAQQRGQNQRTETGMSSEQLNDFLRGLGWSGAELSRRLGVTPKAVSEWRRGKRPVPGPVRAYIRLVVAVTVALREGEGTP